MTERTGGHSLLAGGWWTAPALRAQWDFQGLAVLENYCTSSHLRLTFFPPSVNIYEIGICNAHPVKGFASCWAEELISRCGDNKGGGNGYEFLDFQGANKVAQACDQADGQQSLHPPCPFTQNHSSLDSHKAFFLINFRFLLKFQYLSEVFFDHPVNNDELLLPTSLDLPFLFPTSWKGQRNAPRTGRREK